MRKRIHPLRLVIASSTVVLLLCLPAVPRQARHAKPGQNQQKPGTIHVNVALVQTDVMVFDRQGRFVSDLKPEQFELRVDGQVQPISFMEVVSAGSPHDEEIWAKETGNVVLPPQQPPAKRSNPGRTVLFFVDDWHLSADSVMRSRVALSNLINTTVGPKDRVGIFAATGTVIPTT